jgi:glycogen debranching enzyme
MHRYTAVDPNADRDNWGEVFRLKGVDVTVYLYELKRALAAMARRIGKDDDAGLWDMEADRTRDAVRTKMWDPGQEMFFDIDPKTGVRTGVKAATCFYPYFTDIVTKEHLAGLRRHLLSPKEFWTPWPVPSTSVDDPTFSAEPVWKGKRMNCPWNGRVWPMTNSHIMEALASSARRFNDPRLEEAASEFLSKFVRMLFFDQDPMRPNCFEHYHPYTGQPSAYRGVDDYMHSWVNDLIIQHLMGIHMEEGLITIRPLRCGVAKAEINGIRVQGHELGITINKDSFSVQFDGSDLGRRPMGESLEIMT